MTLFFPTDNKLNTAAWWQLRVLHIHQSLLDENSSQLFDEIETLIDHLSQNLLSQHKELKMDFALEMVHVYLTYGVISKVQQMMSEVNRMSDMSMELTG